MYYLLFGKYSGRSLDWGESEAPLFYTHVLQIFPEFCLTKYLHSCELICFLSVNDMMQIVKSLGCSFKLFYVLHCAMVLCWYLEGMKLQLCNSTTYSDERVLAAFFSEMNYNGSG